MGNLYLTYREGFPQDLNSSFLEYSDGSLITYAELDKYSSQYANGFLDLGLKPGDRVSVHVE